LILTVSHNHFEVIRSCLASLSAHRSTFETLLIDNAGADPTAAWMRIHRAEVRVPAQGVKRRVSPAGGSLNDIA
jgi:GT2 family glycosyltransferase